MVSQFGSAVYNTAWKTLDGPLGLAGVVVTLSTVYLACYCLQVVEGDAGPQSSTAAAGPAARRVLLSNNNKQLLSAVTSLSGAA